MKPEELARKITAALEKKFGATRYYMGSPARLSDYALPVIETVEFERELTIILEKIQP